MSATCATGERFLAYAFSIPERLANNKMRTGWTGRGRNAPRPRPRSIEELRHDTVVIALRAQQQFAYFAYCAASACSLGNVMHAPMDIRAAIRHADTEADARQDRHIDNIVANETALLG